MQKVGFIKRDIAHLNGEDKNRILKRIILFGNEIYNFGIELIKCWYLIDVLFLVSKLICFVLIPGKSLNS
jgi:hypothetical protein